MLSVQRVKKKHLAFNNIVSPSLMLSDFIGVESNCKNIQTSTATFIQLSDMLASALKLNLDNEYCNAVEKTSSSNVIC